METNISLKDSAVKVAVREKPIASTETEFKSIIDYDSGNKNVIIVSERPFVFDYILGPEISQFEVFDKLIYPLVKKSVKGFNCTALAYGQTGTGKTYTMGLHPEYFQSNDVGFIPRALTAVFDLTSNSYELNEPKIFISFIEIYNEKVYDLLSGSSSEQINTKGFKFKGGLKKSITNVEEGFIVLKQGNKNRHIRPTKMNTQSSRSHAIFTIHILSKTSTQKIESSLNFVDLAGSEGVRRTEHQGIALTEGVHINQGLLSIGKVLQALSTGGKIIPYRDSVLSSVLQDSLNTNSYLTLLACISPLKNDLSETLSTLRFTQNAKDLKGNPQINAIMMEIKNRKSRTPFKLPLKQKNIYTPDSLIKRQRKTFYTPNTNSKILKTVNGKKCNQTDVCIATNLKSKCEENNLPVHSTPFNGQEQHSTYTASENNQTIDPRESLFDMNVSTSTAIDVPVSQFLNPLEHRPISAFEQTLQIKKKLDCMSGFYNSNISLINRDYWNAEENLSTYQKHINSHWNSMKNEIRNECSQQINSENSYRLETRNHLPQIAADNSKISDCSFTFKTPFQQTLAFDHEKGKELQKEITSKALNWDTTIIENQESISNSSIKTTVLPTISKKRHSLAFKTINKGNLRRSKRLSMKKHTKENKSRNSSSNQHSSLLQAPNKKKKRAPTENSFIAKYFESPDQESKQNICKSNANSKTAVKHQKAVLDLLNTASIKELQILPLVGLKTAYQIITHRTLHGKFKNFDQVRKLPIWRGSTWDRFKAVNNIL